MKRDANKPSGTVPFGPARVSPGLDTDPIAQRTKAAMESRGKYTSPVGGGPSPAMPRLDMPATQGSTMATQAIAQRSPPPAPGPAVLAAAGMIQPPSVNTASSAPPGMMQQGPAKQVNMPLLPGDTLPDAARQDPAFREGAGSMYATSQPELARKYGVIRSGRIVPPQQLVGAKSSLSQETVKGLTAAVEFQKTRQTQENATDAHVEDAASAGPAGQAARFGQTSDAKPLTEEDRRKIAERIDDFDFHTLREMMLKDILNNDEQRKIIESRLESMDLASYIVDGFVTQYVRINSKLAYTFQSVDGETDLALKRLIVTEAKGFSVDDRYVLDRYAIMSMTCALVEVNNIKLPSYFDSEGHFNADLFWVKFTKVAKLGVHLLASVGINAYWFDIRVRKLLLAESLGNG